MAGFKMDSTYPVTSTVFVPKPSDMIILTKINYPVSFVLEKY